MTGLGGKRVYLDWNATAPLRPEARDAMLQAMDVVGNPSSVHAEGRAAKKTIETARGQVAALVGCAPEQVVFTSGATEAAMTALKGMRCARADVEHDCVAAWTELALGVDRNGVIEHAGGAAARQTANSETGVVQAPVLGCVFADAAQSVGKVSFSFAETGASGSAVSAHKIGGPKGCGALLCRDIDDFEFRMAGGGQEQGRRSGTENVIGIAGFGAAAETARRDLEAGVWEPIEKLRNILEDTLADAAGKTIFFGQESSRLPNTSCFAVPGWAGETQVMQMDLAGFAVSAGSACSSGKVQKASRVLLAMGFDEVTASSAIRVSMGPTTTEAEVMAFAETWIEAYRRRESRAA
ncbi:MAG: cysteine desulfurase family protein [Pseudomonadota bacterium]